MYSGPRLSLVASGKPDRPFQAIVDLGPPPSVGNDFEINRGRSCQISLPDGGLFWFPFRSSARFFAGIPPIGPHFENNRSRWTCKPKGNLFWIRRNEFTPWKSAPVSRLSGRVSVRIPLSSRKSALGAVSPSSAQRKSRVNSVHSSEIFDRKPGFVLCLLRRLATPPRLPIWDLRTGRGIPGFPRVAV